MHNQKDVIMKHKLDKSSMFNNFYISLTRLWKLLFFMKRKIRGNNAPFIFDDPGNYSLKIHSDTLKAMQSMENVIYRVKTTLQGDSFTCGQHIIRYFDEIVRINHEMSSSKLNRVSFEKKLVNSIQLKLYAGECRKLRSESLEYVLNTNFSISMFIKNLKPNF